MSSIFCERGRKTCSYITHISSLETQMAKQRKELEGLKEDNEIQLSRERESHLQLTNDQKQT